MTRDGKVKGTNNMEDNKKFELNDEALDSVAGGWDARNSASDEMAAQGLDSIEYKGITWRVGDRVWNQCQTSCTCCGGLATGTALGFEDTYIKRIFVKMDCCGANMYSSLSDWVRSKSQ